MPWPIPEEISINGELYSLLEVRPGVRKWDTVEVPSQPGDGGKLVAFPLEFHGGFGASRRSLDGQGRASDPSHHAYAENMQTHIKGTLAAAPRVTLIDLSAGTKRSTGFQFGGKKSGQLGGGSGYTSLGGGTIAGVLLASSEFGSYLYFSGGTATFTIDPSGATPALVETRQHPTADARATSQDVFGSRLLVALGANVDMAVATAPYDSISGQSAWTTATDVKMQAVRSGGGGRLFSAQDNLVFNVLPDQSPESLANYLPPAGESVADSADHVHALAEYARGLVASTHTTLRTFDPDSGFVSRPLLPTVRTTAATYHGLGLITVGEDMFFANTRAVWWFRVSRGLTAYPPERIGPELLDNNETPYKGGEPGVPAWDGEVLWWPFYYPTTDDSVIWRVAPRKQGEPGTGPFVWSEYLFLADTQCRVVQYWGGDATYKPRLFFGAGTTTTPQQVGWVQQGRGGTPDLFDAGSVPALTATLYGPIDDFTKPGVVREADRIEFPTLLNNDASNYLVASISDNEGTSYKDLVKTNSGAANDQRITATGFAVVFADVNTPSIPAGRTLQLRLVITQASGATTHVQVRGTPQLYCLERPSTVEQVTTLIKVKANLEPDGHTKTTYDTLRALLNGAKVPVLHAPGDTSFYMKVSGVKSVEVETFNANGDRSAREAAVELTWRAVATS